MSERDARTKATTLLRRVDEEASSEAAAALQDLIPDVYEELKKIAERVKGNQAASIAPTGLVHEVFLRLVDKDEVAWRGQSHFLALAARVMRQVLIDRQRMRLAAKRGGDWQRVTLAGISGRDQEEVDLLALEEALEKLQELDPRQCQVVEMRFFGGLTAEQIADVLGVSSRTIESEWRHARVWLRRELDASQGSDN